MASGAKKKTTMAKLMRENRLRERRFDKQAKKDARKLAPARPDWDGEPLDPTAEATGGADEALLAGAPAPTDA
jgi:hypothetical protein